MSLSLPPLTSVKDPAVAAALRAISDWARTIEPELTIVNRRNITKQIKTERISQSVVNLPRQRSQTGINVAARDIVNTINSDITKSVVRKFIENSGLEPAIRLNAPVVFETVNGPARIWIGAGGIGGTYNNIATFGITSVDGSFFFGKETTPSKQITFDATTGDLTFGSDIKLNFPNAETLEDLYNLASAGGGYTTQDLSNDLAAGINNIIATSTSSDAMLTITPQYLVAMSNNAVYNGYSSWADANNTRTPGLAVGAGGIFGGYNDVDGNWVNSFAIDASTGNASFVGQITAKGGSIVENFFVGASLSVGAGGVFRCQKTSYSDTQAGWWMSYNNGNPNFHLGNASQWIKFDTTNGLKLSGAATLDSGSTLTSLGQTANWTQISSMPSALYNYTGASDATRNKLSYQSSAPSNPAEGDLWCDTSIIPYRWKIYSLGAWREAGSLITSSVSPSTYISAGALHGDRVTAGTITASHISVSTLSAISANMGSITTGSINTDNFMRAYGRYGTGFTVLPGVTSYAAGVFERNNVTVESSTGLAGISSTSTNTNYYNFGLVGRASGKSSIGVYGEGNGSTTGAGGYFRGYGSANYGAYCENIGGGYALYVLGPSKFVSDIDVSGYMVTATFFSGPLYTSGHTFRHNGGVTTGAGTASFPGNNKPGGNTSAQWLPVLINGSQYYIPVWQ